jgi:hypothetical protein
LFREMLGEHLLLAFACGVHGAQDGLERCSSDVLHIAAACSR